MAQFFRIHPTHPQVRLIKETVQILRKGGVAAYPTDCCYALGCCIGEKSALERIKTIRRLSDKHQFSLLCMNLNQVTKYAKVSNWTFRTLKAYTPGAYTFLLDATREVPRRLLHTKKRIIGVRIPDSELLRMILTELDEPLMSTTLRLPQDEQPMSDAVEIRDRLQHVIDLVIESDHVGFDMSTVVDLTTEVPRVIRAGKGDPEPFQYEA